MEMPKKVLNTREYVSVLRELTELGNEVSLKIAGNSMAPFLVHERDVVVFKKPDRELKRGDIVFFQRDCGRFILHRIWRVKPEGYYIVGDAQWDIEGPIRREQIFGIVTKVCRKGKWFGPGAFWWEFFEHVWIHMIPCRRGICKAYARCSRIWKRR